MMRYARLSVACSMQLARSISRIFDDAGCVWLSRRYRDLQLCELSNSSRRVDDKSEPPPDVPSRFVFRIQIQLHLLPGARLYCHVVLKVRDAGEVADASSDVDAAAAASTDTSADTASEGGSRNIGETLSTEGNQREVRDHRLDGRNSAAEESRADAQSVGTIPGAPSGGEESRSSPGKKRVRFDPEIKGGVWVQRHSNTGVGGVANGSGSHNRQRMVQLPIQLVRKQIQHQIELQGELTRLKAAVQQQRREQQRINTTLVSCIKVLEQRNAELSDGLPASGHGSGSPR